jgi:hypothetical protein
MNIPDYVAPIVGYRVWHWSDYRLISLKGKSWPPEEALEATCGRAAAKVPGFDWAELEARIRSHEAPLSTCSCGIYATKRREQLPSISFGWHGISGAVYLWGRLLSTNLDGERNLLTQRMSCSGQR